jgi:hypothetical protein
VNPSVFHDTDRLSPAAFEAMTSFGESNFNVVAAMVAHPDGHLTKVCNKEDHQKKRDKCVAEISVPKELCIDQNVGRTTKRFCLRLPCEHEDRKLSQKHKVKLPTGKNAYPRVIIIVAIYGDRVYVIFRSILFATDRQTTAKKKRTREQSDSDSDAPAPAPKRTKKAPRSVPAPVPSALPIQCNQHLHHQQPQLTQPFLQDQAAPPTSQLLQLIQQQLPPLQHLPFLQDQGASPPIQFIQHLHQQQIQLTEQQNQNIHSTTSEVIQQPPPLKPALPLLPFKEEPVFDLNI